MIATGYPASGNSHSVNDGPPPFFFRASDESIVLGRLAVHLTFVVSVVLFVWQPLPICELIRKSGQWNIVLVPG